MIFFRPSENVYLKRIDYINKFRENFYLSSATIKIPLLFILAVLEEKKIICSLGTMGLILSGHKSSQSNLGDLYQRKICTTR